MIDRWLSLERDESPMRAYLAMPDDTSATTPSVVIAMHVWGVDEAMRLAAKRFAENGIAAIVPDLYARFNAPKGSGSTDHRIFVPFAQKLTSDGVSADIAASVAYLRERFASGNIAIAGFCMGGVVALRRTSGNASTFSAAAVWYGALDKANPKVADIPIVASYGADDHGIPAETVDAFRSQLPVPHDFRIYIGAGHGFADSTRASYAADAAESSWSRVIAFLKPFLGAS
jgi:carboxymethylenebutenolidase